PAFLDQLVLVRPLPKDFVAAFGGQGHHRRTAARGPVAANLVQAVEGQVAAAHHPGVDLGVFGQGGPAPDGPAVELEDPVVREAAGPARGVLAVDGVATAGAQFLDRELVSPFVFRHGTTTSGGNSTARRSNAPTQQRRPRAEACIPEKPASRPPSAAASGS